MSVEEAIVFKNGKEMDYKQRTVWWILQQHDRDHPMYGEALEKRLSEEPNWKWDTVDHQREIREVAHDLQHVYGKPIGSSTVGYFIMKTKNEMGEAIVHKEKAAFGMLKTVRVLKKIMEDMITQEDGQTKLF